MKPSLPALSLIVGLSAGCNPPAVVQGTVVSYDVPARSIVVRDDNPPNAELVISAANADIGAEPAAGDVVRIAYRDENGFLRATRVMNLTRQQESKKKGKRE